MTEYKKEKGPVALGRIPSNAFRRNVQGSTYGQSSLGAGSKHKSVTDQGFVAGALGHAIRGPGREGGARNVGETDRVIDDREFYRARAPGLQS